jgi:hypothetical protein
MKLPKPWMVSSVPKKGAATREELYLAVGAALSAWELVEEGLAEIFALFVGASVSGHDPAIRAFGSVLTFKGRQEMVCAAKESFFLKAAVHEPLVKQFGELNEEAGGFAGRRNEIAHGRVQSLSGKGFYLLPGLYNTSKNPINPQTKNPLLAYAYGPKEIESYREGFELLASKLSDYANGWAPPKPSQKKHPQPSALPQRRPRKSRAKNGHPP